MRLCNTVKRGVPAGLFRDRAPVLFFHSAGNIVAVPAELRMQVCIKTHKSGKKQVFQKDFYTKSNQDKAASKLSF